MKQKQKQNLQTQKNFTLTRTMTCILRISINNNGSRSNALKKSLTQSLMFTLWKVLQGGVCRCRWVMEHYPACLRLQEQRLGPRRETNKTEQSHCHLPAYEAELSCLSEFLFWNNFSWNGQKRFGRSRKRDNCLSGCFLARSPP